MYQDFLLSLNPFLQYHKIIKKHVNLDRARRLVEYANKRNLYTRCNFIIGFPNEKREHIQETIDYIKNLSSDWFSIFLATPLVGTEMFEQFMNQGVLDHSSRDWETNFQGRNFDTSDLTAGQLMEIVYRTNLEANFIGNRQMKIGNWALALEVFNDVLKLHPYHVIAHYMCMLCFDKLGKFEASKERFKKIVNLVQTVKVSADMLRKYGGLVPELIKMLNNANLDLNTGIEGENVNRFLYSQTFNTGSDILKFGTNTPIEETRVTPGVQSFEKSENIKKKA